MQTFSFSSLVKPNALVLSGTKEIQRSIHSATSHRITPEDSSHAFLKPDLGITELERVIKQSSQQFMKNMH